MKIIEKHAPPVPTWDRITLELTREEFEMLRWSIGRTSENERRQMRTGWDLIGSNLFQKMSYVD